MEITTKTIPETLSVCKTSDLVLCPVCRQKLTGIASLNGKVKLEVKCRRCKNVVLVYASDNTVG